MNVDLNMFKEKSKFASSWNSITKSEHNKNKSKGQEAHKAITISEKAS